MESCRHHSEETLSLSADDVHPRTIQHQEPHHQTHSQVFEVRFGISHSNPIAVKEASELANNASPDYHAEPLEDNLFEWHFTLRGPPAPSPYADGLYHGRIVLPPTYPLRPPSFRFLTPTGRFEVNREICLSISGHHEETWQPAWGIRTAMVAIRTFMDTDAKGQIGGLECSESARRRMAGESWRYRCATCGKSNRQIMSEREEAAKQVVGERKEELVPTELRLAYREDLGKGEGSSDNKNGTSSSASASLTAIPSNVHAAQPPTLPRTPKPPTAATTRPTPTSPSSSARPQTSSASRSHPQQQRQRRDTASGVPGWLDKAIWGVFAALVFMIARKIFAA